MAPSRVAVKAVPAAENRKLRPVRTDMPRLPTRPRLIAETVGVIRPALNPCSVMAANTRGSVGASARISAAVQIIATPAATSPRFQGTASASAPPGIKPSTAASPLTPSANPTLRCDQPRLAR